jgi:23S rRNA (uracil1939-C5)-methyltransferase
MREPPRRSIEGWAGQRVLAGPAHVVSGLQCRVGVCEDGTHGRQRLPASCRHGAVPKPTSGTFRPRRLARSSGTLSRSARQDRASGCSHLPACPGCPRFGAPGPAPQALRQLEQLGERHALRAELEIGARLAFRQRARLAVRGRVGRAKIGLFAEGSHRVVDIPSCPIHHPLINEVAQSLKASMRELGSSCYGEGAHAGLVRALQVVVERSSQSAQIVLVCNDRSPDAALPLLDLLKQRLGARLHSAWWNGNPDVTNRILGDLFHPHAGPANVVEKIGGARVFFPPAAFGQNNLELFDRMVERIHASVPAGSHVVELYAGCGAIGLGLAARSASLVFNEINPASLAGLALGIGELDAEQRQHILVVPGPAQEGCREIQTESVVIVDPPRKGLDPEVLQALALRPPRRLLYLSCELGSLVRDAEQLSAQGLRLEALTAYDSFPYTEHLETLASFRRP